MANSILTNVLIMCWDFLFVLFVWFFFLVLYCEDGMISLSLGKKRSNVSSAKENNQGNAEVPSISI